MIRLYTAAVWIILVQFIFSGAAQARTVNGIDLPETLQFGNTQLQLNGAGVRTKFIFDIYVGALYVTEPGQSPSKLINDDLPNQVSMYFLYDEISKKKMTAAWNDGFEDALDERTLAQLKPSIQAFTNAFGDTRKGDVIAIRYLPQTGTQVIVNGDARTTIPGQAFHKALMQLWFGESPVDDGLKQGMLNLRDDE